MPPAPDRAIRLLLTLAVGLFLASAASSQGGDEWTAPYPQLPEYRELIGRLFTEGPPTNRPAPDITSRGVIAAGVFKPRVQPGEIRASYAAFTYAKDGNGLPAFGDLRTIVKDVTSVRRGRGPAAAYERRVGTPTPETQLCVDGQMVFRMFQLDARWSSVAACQDTLSWSEWRPDGGSEPAAPVPPAAGYRWLQRVPDMPAYREYVGRLFGETSAANADANFNNLTAPAAIAIGSFKSSARPGETIATFGTQFFNLDSDNKLDIPNLRIVVNNLTEVRFTLAGTRGVIFDTRKGTPVYGYHQCLEGRVPRSMYLIDGRWRAMVQCENLVTWTPWTGERLRPFAGSVSVEGVATFDYAWDADAGRVAVNLK